MGRLRLGLGAYDDSDGGPLQPVVERHRRRGQCGSRIPPRLLPPVQSRPHDAQAKPSEPRRLCRTVLPVRAFGVAEPNSGLSQHETLRRLAQIEGALVYYACPLLFDLDKIYEYPDLDSLRVVDVQSAPPGIKADDRHFIAFQGLSDLTPVWCSEPYPARGQRGSEWIGDAALRPRRRTGADLVELISKVRSVLSEGLDEPRKYMGGARPWLPRSFTILSFSF